MCSCTRTLTCGLNQGQCFQLSSHQDLLYLSVGGGESDVTHVSNHDVLHTDVILPEGGDEEKRAGEGVRMKEEIDEERTRNYVKKRESVKKTVENRRE